MIQKVLIANRGEIAVRIIRACKDMGIRTVAVYSEDDKQSLHVQIADESLCIGPAKLQESYLSVKNILSAAVSSGVQAIHPGFGFLSENEYFAKMINECKIKFIGPSSEAISLMGNKSKAREIMIEAGVPVVPGSDGSIKSPEEGIIIAKEIGYPVLIKASSGGGGKGMRIAHSDKEFTNAFDMARLEAKNAFGDATVYLEKYIEKPKHIEFQILADSHGNVVHLGERDCSVQRRHQKLIEESPSIFLSEKLRKEMGETAVRAAKAIGYENAGTIEFLVDKNSNYYFIEMNTRIQVEHPVTEMVTGLDLIKEQIKITDGEKLAFSQDEIELKGHAIECRINAEDPQRNFMPCPGKIKVLHLPGGNGVRVDSGVYQGYTVSPRYDSMVSKLIVHAPTRKEAIRKMRRALEEFIVDGITTNVEFQYLLLHNPIFVRGDHDTGFIAKYYED